MAAPLMARRVGGPRRSDSLRTYVRSTRIIAGLTLLNRVEINSFEQTPEGVTAQGTQLDSNQPITIRAEETVLPFIFNATEAEARGQSSASFWRTS